MAAAATVVRGNPVPASTVFDASAGSTVQRTLNDTAVETWTGPGLRSGRQTAARRHGAGSLVLRVCNATGVPNALFPYRGPPPARTVASGWRNRRGRPRNPA
jgi:hypothetical protein